MKIAQTYKTAIIAGVVVLVIIIASIFIVQGSANKAISLEEDVATCKSDIDVQINRKVNVLTELTECVKQYDAHEYETLMAAINARSSSDSGDVDAQEIINQVQAVAEAYPELKSQDNYKTLMNEISVTENLLAQYKSTCNTSVRNYNRYCKKFPSRIFLGMCGYEKVEYQYYSTDKTDSEPMSLFGDE